MSSGLSLYVLIFARQTHVLNGILCKQHTALAVEIQLAKIKREKNTHNHRQTLEYRADKITRFA